MILTRNLKLNISGEDVYDIKVKLFELGYYSKSITKISNKTFGKDTEKAVINFQKKNDDKNNKPLDADGIVGPLTWEAIEKAYSVLQEQKKIEEEKKKQEETTSNKTLIPFTRILTLNTHGEDVFYIKNMLFEMGYYNKTIKKISNKYFRNDTKQAVILFQGRNSDVNGDPLRVDGIVGAATYSAIEKVYAVFQKQEKEESEKPVSMSVSLQDFVNNYTHIEKLKRIQIAADLAKVNELRQKMCLEILDYAYDQDAGGECRGLYMIGGNLYNKDLTINIPTAADVRKQADRRPDYYDGGREEWIIKQLARDPKLPASDCSGMEIGLMRKYGLISNGTDTTANVLSTKATWSTKITRKELMAGDWVAKDGHIGMYVGGGYVVEFYGGAYGCQLTNVDNRIGYNFVERKLYRGGAWTRFRRPTKY